MAGGMSVDSLMERRGRSVRPAKHNRTSVPPLSCARSATTHADPTGRPSLHVEQHPTLRGQRRHRGVANTAPAGVLGTTRSSAAPTAACRRPTSPSRGGGTVDRRRRGALSGASSLGQAWGVNIPSAPRSHQDAVHPAIPRSGTGL